MKATIEIPDELYRKVKAKSALEGRHVRDVTIALYELWLNGQAGAASSDAQAALEWLDEWRRFGEEIFRDAPPGPSAREILLADRDRF